eukprot:gene224-biopygen199
MKRLCDLLHRVVQSRAGISWVRACFGDGAEPPEDSSWIRPWLEDGWHGRLSDAWPPRTWPSSLETTTPSHLFRGRLPSRGCVPRMSQMPPGVDTSTSSVPFVAVA